MLDSVPAGSLIVFRNLSPNNEGSRAGIAEFAESPMTRQLRRRLVPAVVLPLIVGGCPAATPTASSPPFTREGNDLRHVASAMLFPSTIGRFQRGSSDTFDAIGKDVDVAYNLVDVDRPVAATVFVYPAPFLISVGSPENVVADARAHLAREEFERRKMEIVRGHPGAALLQEAPATLSQGTQSITGWRATFAYTGDFAGRGRALRSELFVFCFVGGWWSLEYRFTYPQEVTPRAEIDSFMSALSVPYRIGARL